MQDDNNGQSNSVITCEVTSAPLLKPSVAGMHHPPTYMDPHSNRAGSCFLQMWRVVDVYGLMFLGVRSVGAAQSISASLRKRPTYCGAAIDVTCQKPTYSAQQLGGGNGDILRVTNVPFD